MITSTRSPCFTPHRFYIFSFFSFNASCQYTPVLNSRPLVFGLTTFGRLRCITLSRSYSVISCENIVFDLRILFLTQLFSYTAKALNVSWCNMKVVIHPKSYSEFSRL